MAPRRYMLCLSVGFGACILVLDPGSRQVCLLQPVHCTRLCSTTSSYCFTGTFCGIGTQVSRTRVMLQSRRDELERLAASRESEAALHGKVVNAKLQRMRTTKAFLHFAEKRGAKLQSGKSGRVKVSTNGVSWDFSVRVEEELQNSARKMIIVAFKAMDIAFGEK
uniref:Uncharacterized protein n=1 Tax=Alexandrium catenella TaxID=2925 RepID=A0A7S1SBJ9_ALECA